MSTASATVSRLSVRDVDPHPQALERQLLLSYFAVFATAFVAAAFIVRLIFGATLDEQMSARLQTVALAGLRSILWSDGHFAVDRAEIARTRLLSRDQGLQWFDARGRSLGSEGLTPAMPPDGDGIKLVNADGQAFNTFSLAVANPATRARAGTVRASELDAASAASIRWFDVGLFIGTLLAILGSGMAGVALTRRAVRPVVGAFETLRDFTADASHELRSPLAAISSNADAALRDESRLPERDRSRFEAIADAARQMSRLTNDLLLLAVANASLEDDLFVVDLSALMDRVAQRFAVRFASAGIELSTTIARGTIAYGNPDQLARIVSNLLENALRFTPHGGSVWVEAVRERSRLLVRVRDTGVGIEPQQLGQIFERFWRADSSRSSEGAGLGLAIARALARRHGGDVTVTSRAGSGSEFTISLPVRPSLKPAVTP